MKTKNTMMAILVAFALVTLSGCLDSARKTSAQNRWQRTMDKARIQAAQESLEQGNVAYAQLVLEDCLESNSSISHDAQLMLAQIRTTQEQFAKNQDENIDSEQAY